MSLAPEAAGVEPAPAAASRHVSLVVVLVVLMAAISLDRVASGLWRPFLGRTSNVWTDALFYGQQGAAVLCAGVLVDRFGLKRLVGLALVGWCCLVMLSGAIERPPGAGIEFLVILVVGMIYIAPDVAVKRGTRSGESALPLAITFLASYLWLAAISPLHVFLADTRPLDPDPSAFRTWLALVCATVGSFIAMVWLVLYRECGRSDERAGRSIVHQIPIFLADRRVWTLLLLSGLAAVTFEIGQHRLFGFLDLQRDVKAATVGVVIYAPYLAAIAGSLVAAVWSDRILRRTGSLARARRPFAVAAFALAATLGLVPLVRQADVIAMSSIAGAGLGMQVIISVIVLDIAPLRSVGTLAGLVAAFETLVRFVVYEVEIVLYQSVRSYGPLLTLGAIAGLLGAIAAHRLLRRIEPIREPAANEAIPTIFA